MTPQDAKFFSNFMGIGNLMLQILESCRPSFDVITVEYNNPKYDSDI
jgi:hypothetical protein